MLKCIFVTLGLTKIHIETDKVENTGEKSLIFISRLSLTDVSLNSPTTFGCSVTDNEEEESRTYGKQLSFAVTGMDFSLRNYTVKGEI